MTALLWFRGHDLRLIDNEALHAAARVDPVLPVYLHAPEDEENWPLGGAARWWLNHSLASLERDLSRHGAQLLLRRTSDSVTELLRLVEETGARAIFTHRRSEPAAAAVEQTLAGVLRERGIELHLSETHTLIPLGSLRTGTGTPYRVFTPFWRGLLARGEPADPVGVPTFEVVSPTPTTEPLASLGLLDGPDWAEGLRQTWQPGEAGARCRLEDFCARAREYGQWRDRPDLHGTSALSPHLRFGEISPRQAWHAVRAAAGTGAEPWLRQLAWRDFGHHLLHHFPHTTIEPLRPAFAGFPWREDATGLRDWQRGRTGYPLVDAGMRQLWHTGWMHNRVRMVVASFLVKDLMIEWQHGTRWFWETLVDADLASNTLGWQWTAGCGADAAPYFRVFNPVSQGERFDPEATYIRRWVCELSTHNPRDAQRPWQVPLVSAQYTPPIVDHAQARQRALSAYAEVRAQVVA